MSARRRTCVPFVASRFAGRSDPHQAASLTIACNFLHFFLDDGHDDDDDDDDGDGRRNKSLKTRA